MKTPAWTIELDHVYSAYLLLGTLAAMGLAGLLLYGVGVVGGVLRLVGLLIRGSIRLGFRLWERLFARATWPVFLPVVLGLLVVGVALAGSVPLLSILISLALLFSGATTCLAYMFIDLERYEVQRGYKAVHNPLKGQEPAVHLAQYGHQVGLLLLIVATAAMIGGFSLLNQGLYETIGRDWYKVGDEVQDLVFADFLASALINLLRVVDVLNVAQSHHLMHIAYVHPSAWPAAILMAAFRMFFTVVLLQQVFASLRHGKLLAETIADFWSPHEPIHERARNALPQYGSRVVRPLLASLRTIGSLTREQRDQLPATIATIGPSAIPALVRCLDDAHEPVRAIAAAALAHLHAVELAPLLVPLVADSSPAVRESLVEALGILGSAGSAPTSTRHTRALVAAARGRRLRWWFGRKKRLEATADDPMALIVETLSAALGDERAAVRARAAEALGRVGAPAASSALRLIDLLEDADETVRCRAAGALGQVGGEGEATVEALAALLQEAGAAVKEAAARALGALKKKAEPAVSALAPLLHDREESVREAAAQAIAQIGSLNEAAAETLMEGLSSQDNFVRARTAEALGAIGPAAHEAAPALVEAVEDGNDRVRAKAVEALGKMGESAAAAALPSMVRALHDPDNWVSALAAEALGQMGESGEAAVPALIRSLGHANALVRGNAAESLGRLGSAADGARLALEKAVGDEDGGVRGRAIRALGAVGPPTRKGRKTAAVALQDADPFVRAAAVEALGQWGEVDAATVQRVMALLEDANDEVKAAAVGVLPKLAGPTAAVIEGLCRRVEEDDSPTVQVHAALALGKLGSAAAAAGETLLRAVRTAEVSVREQAMRAIAAIQPPEGAEAFTAGLTDASSDIRKAASGGWLKAATIPEDALGPLVSALADPEVQVRANAAMALGRLDALPEGAMPRLIECTAGARDDLRLNAAMALRLAPAEEVREVMEHLLQDESVRVRLIAAGSLLAANREDERAKEVVREGLADASPGVRKAALGLVESLGSEGFAEVLQERRAVEEEPRVREVLDRALEQMTAVAGGADQGSEG